MPNAVGTGTALPGVNTGLPVNRATAAAGAANENPTLFSESGTGGFLGSLFGQVPGVANPVSSANSAIAGNLENLGGNAALTYDTDAISAAGAALPFKMNLPDYTSMLDTATGNTSQELEGQVPSDVQNLIAQQAAERGVATGEAPGSPNTTAAYLQALGLTSLGQEQQGFGNLQTLIGETPTGTSYNPSAMFVSPTDEQSAAQAVQTAVAAPDPGASGLFSSIMSFL